MRLVGQIVVLVTALNLFLVSCSGANSSEEDADCAEILRFGSQRYLLVSQNPPPEGRSLGQGVAGVCDGDRTNSISEVSVDVVTLKGVDTDLAVGVHAEGEDQAGVWVNISIDESEYPTALNEILGNAK